MIEINKSNQEVSSLEDYSIFHQDEIKQIPEDSITRFDRNKKIKHA